MTDQSQGSVANADTSAAPNGFSQGQFEGKYAFRFGGFTMLNLVSYRLAGLGQFSITSTGAVNGTQHSSITPLQGYAKLEISKYEVSGDIKMDADGSGSGSATLTFKRIEGTGRNVLGTFHVVAAGSADRIWMVSAGAFVLGTAEPADELVELEATRITAVRAAKDQP
jgi:hypothetical protein